MLLAGTEACIMSRRFLLNLFADVALVKASVIALILMRSRAWFPLWIDLFFGRLRPLKVMKREDVTTLD